jgi:hypothetical protein
MSQRLYNRLFRSVSCSQENATTQDTDITLLSANASQMPIIATINTDIRISGLQSPVTFRVISDFIYNIILGEQFLQETEAFIDVGTNTLTLYRGLCTVPMVKANNLLVIETTASITAPPFSQPLFQVAPVTGVKSGNYMVEGNLQPPTDKIWIGRTMVNPDMAKMCCCALNITDKPLKFRAWTLMGILTPVKICKAFKPEPPPIQENLPPIERMKAALEQNSINLTDTVMKGADHDQLVTLLYKNIDL